MTHYAPKRKKHGGARAQRRGGRARCASCSSPMAKQPAAEGVYLVCPRGCGARKLPGAGGESP
jgi:hypothetical protein